MIQHEQMRFGAQIMAAIFGGPGIFYLWRSFSVPTDGITALFYLAIATVLACYAGNPARLRVPALRRIPFSRKRRP